MFDGRAYEGVPDVHSGVAGGGVAKTLVERHAKHGLLVPTVRPLGVHVRTAVALGGRGG